MPILGWLRRATCDPRRICDNGTCSTGVCNNGVCVDGKCGNGIIDQQCGEQCDPNALPDGCLDPTTKCDPASCTCVSTQNETPSINSIKFNSTTSSTMTVGDYTSVTLTISGTHLANALICYGSSSTDRRCGITPTSHSSDGTTLTYNVPPTTGGSGTGFAAPLSQAGYSYLTVYNQTAGLFSNVWPITIYNPAPEITGFSNTCNANSPCNVYANDTNDGGGFVADEDWIPRGSGQWTINGNPMPQASPTPTPVGTQALILLSASQIPASGAYTIQVCNYDTASGQNCSGSPPLCTACTSSVLTVN